ncbi:ABC transporter permease [Blautia liquoris]|uniref:ABC transporter permease n=1 Tax=Blautia liquoris TaxID=2779518 RepID=A0A7M2RH51_9FIRM|nr:ABC transporter permease [Blautia liquoris]QOV18702.1 ABC transporter permease [Blautia liquoris]
MNKRKNKQLENLASRPQSGFREVWHRLKKNKPAMAGLIIIMIFILAAVFANQISDYEKDVIEQHISRRLLPPSTKHLFGTDGFGRDIFARVIFGARTSLFIAFSTTIVSCIAGGILGSLSAYYRKLDNIIMRIIDTIMCLPPMLFSLSIVAALGPGVRNLVIAVSVTMTPYFTRVVRASVLTIVDSDFVEAARSQGAGDFRIIAKHIIPNSLGPIIVQATMSVSFMIMLAASLSFIGLGVQPPTPEWGAMLSEGREFMRYSWNVVAFPGLAIVLSSLSLNLLGDGLRDALDPKLKD